MSIASTKRIFAKYKDHTYTKEDLRMVELTTGNKFSRTVLLWEQWLLCDYLFEEGEFEAMVVVFERLNKELRYLSLIAITDAMPTFEFALSLNLEEWCKL